MSAPGEPEVTALLCDAASAVGGKLYVLGGGWNLLWPPEPEAPSSMALAIQLNIPWALANRRLNLDARLVTEDGDPVQQEFGEVQATGVVEAGRPAGIREGTPLVLVFALQFPLLRLADGGYVWEISVDEQVRARVPFQVEHRSGAS
jgi:hypothetical protein